MTWRIETVIPTAAVPDLGTAIAFYERLGAVLDWKWPEVEPTHAGLLLASASIMFTECDDPRVPSDVYYIVDDVNACHAAVLAGRCWELAASIDGAPERSKSAPAGPAPTDYGLCDFSVIDPWGNHMSFGTPLEDR